MLDLLMKNWKLRVWCSLFNFFMWFAWFQILICERQSILCKLLVLSWLYIKFNKQITHLPLPLPHAPSSVPFSKSVLLLFKEFWEEFKDFWPPLEEFRQTTIHCNFSFWDLTDISSVLIFVTVSLKDSNWWALDRASNLVSVSRLSFITSCFLRSFTMDGNLWK